MAAEKVLGLLSTARSPSAALRSSELQVAHGCEERGAAWEVLVYRTVLRARALTQGYEPSIPIAPHRTRSCAKREKAVFRVAMRPRPAPGCQLSSSSYYVQTREFDPSHSLRSKLDFKCR
jgi:hypothetical protein